MNMNLAATIFALRWLINDTFRQSLAGRVFWIMLGVSALAIVFCLGISLEGGTIRDRDMIIESKTDKEVVDRVVDRGEMRLLFGMMKVEMHRGRMEEVRLVHVILAVWVAGALGLIMSLVWTASFIPEALQPSSAVVLLAKPAPRWLFLLGKYLGVVLFVAMQGLVFFLGTWMALGVKTGIWNNAYLLGWPLMVLQFAVFYSVSVVLAVTWRSTMACIVGVLLFWATSYGINYGRYAVLAWPTIAGPQATPLSPLARGLAETGYWIFPKPADYAILLEDLLDVDKDRATMSSYPEIQQARANGDFQPFGTLAASVLFALVMIVLAGRQFNDTEY